MFRTLPFLLFFLTILLLSTGYWIINGLTISAGTTPNAAEKVLAEMTAKLQSRNPEAAAELARLKNTYNEAALAATMKERYEISGVDGLERLATYRKTEDSKSGIYDLRLAEMASTYRFDSLQQRHDFIYAHATPFQKKAEIFKRVSSDATLSGRVREQEEAYLRILEEAAKNEDPWRRVRENPLMVFLMQHVDDASLLDFYDREKEWLDDVLFVLLTALEFSQETVSGEEISTTIAEILRTIRENHPFFKDAVVSNLSAPENEVEATVLNTFVLFDRYGKMFRYSLEKGKIPLEELLDVVYANQDYFDKYAADPPEKTAARLITIRDSNPAVWAMAKKSPLCLQLYDDVPHLANTLCEKYGVHDIAAFLYTKYDDAILQAAAAVDKFGDLAVYALNRYEKSEIFRTSLKDDELGVRIIPYVVRFGDKGLEQMDANKNWLDKYFDAEGNEKETEWWAFIPGGAAVKVAQNWSRGYPNEWGELGWAALDVADAALLVASLGASSSVTVSKSATTSAAKAGVKVGSKTIGRDVVETIARAGGRQAIREAEMVAKTAESTSLFRMGMRSSQLSYRLVVQTVQNVTRVALRVGEVVVMPFKTISSQTFNAARSLHVTWTAVPVTTRKAVYRALFYTGITVTLLYRTMPMLAEQLPVIAENLGRFTGELTTSMAKAVPALLNGFLDGMLGEDLQTPYRVFIKWGVIALILAGLFLFMGNQVRRKMFVRA